MFLIHLMSILFLNPPLHRSMEEIVSLLVGLLISHLLQPCSSHVRPTHKSKLISLTCSRPPLNVSGCFQHSEWPRCCSGYRDLARTPNPPAPYYHSSARSAGWQESCTSIESCEHPPTSSFQLLLRLLQDRNEACKTATEFFCHQLSLV